ncbi:chromate resistance protein ChrB domain-containing protein [Bradyrhizobium sp. 2TAF24]|uniref:chromate resistance protein ChrB domain-containing protein n=1 Tax=Bradyrhizobium sp. 2TAF24 TaxID=3233011 RepID=UPI003F9207A5
MPALNAIAPDKLFRLLGSATCPVLVDVRTDDDVAADPRMIPTAIRRSHAAAPAWTADFPGQTVIVICRHGHGLSEGAAAWLRLGGATAAVLEGGFQAWASERLPLVPSARIPNRDTAGRTVWVTRARPKIDRIACPWLIRRFIDHSAVFLFVTASQVEAVADRFGAVPFDIENVHWSHRGERCTFDVMVEEFGLATEPLLHLATIVRAADTARLDLAPEAPGLLAASLGLSRMHADDLEQLEAGLTLYDAFYRWCRDATDETHNWPHKTKPKAKA